MKITNANRGHAVVVGFYFAAVVVMVMKVLNTGDESCKVAICFVFCCTSDGDDDVYVHMLAVGDTDGAAEGAADGPAVGVADGVAVGVAEGLVCSCAIVCARASAQCMHRIRCET